MTVTTTTIAVTNVALVNVERDLQAQAAVVYGLTADGLINIPDNHRDALDQFIKAAAHRASVWGYGTTFDVTITLDSSSDGTDDVSTSLTVLSHHP